MPIGSTWAMATAGKKASSAVGPTSTPMPTAFAANSAASDEHELVGEADGEHVGGGRRVVAQLLEPEVHGAGEAPPALGAGEASPKRCDGDQREHDDEQHERRRGQGEGDLRGRAEVAEPGVDDEADVGQQRQHQPAGERSSTTDANDAGGSPFSRDRRRHAQHVAADRRGQHVRDELAGQVVVDRRPRWRRTPSAVSTACHRIDDSTMPASVRAAAPSEPPAGGRRPLGDELVGVEVGRLRDEDAEEHERCRRCAAASRRASGAPRAASPRRRRPPDHARTPFQYLGRSGECTGGAVDGTTRTRRGTRRDARRRGARRASACTELYTLSGGHIFPFYDAAVKVVSPPVRLVDVRHEQTATLRRRGHREAHPPARRRGAHRRSRRHQRRSAAVTAAHFNGSPLVVLGGRAPQARWVNRELNQ